MPQQIEDSQVSVPVVEETAAVEKRQRITGTVRLRTDLHEEEVVIDEPLLVEAVEVERVGVDRWIDGPVPIRQEGDTTIVPILEEMVVVEKRLKLTEEVRITKRRSTRHAPQRVTLRRQEAVVDRLAAPLAEDAGPAAAPGRGGRD